MKKGIDRWGGICYNHQRCRENSERAERTTTAILENDTEKQVILYKKMRSAGRCEDASEQSDSERVKRLDEMKEADGFGESAAEIKRVKDKD